MASFEHESQFFRSSMNVLQNLRWISQNKNSKDGTPRKETLARFKEVRFIFKCTLLKYLVTIWLDCSRATKSFPCFMHRSNEVELIFMVCCSLGSSLKLDDAQMDMLMGLKSATAEKEDRTQTLQLRYHFHLNYLALSVNVFTYFAATEQCIIYVMKKTAQEMNHRKLLPNSIRCNKL